MGAVQEEFEMEVNESLSIRLPPNPCSLMSVQIGDFMLFDQSGCISLPFCTVGRDERRSRAGENPVQVQEQCCSFSNTLGNAE